MTIPYFASDIPSQEVSGVNHYLSSINYQETVSDMPGQTESSVESSTCGGHPWSDVFPLWSSLEYNIVVFTLLHFRLEVYVIFAHA